MPSVAASDLLGWSTFSLSVDNHRLEVVRSKFLRNLGPTLPFRTGGKILPSLVDPDNPVLNEAFFCVDKDSIPLSSCSLCTF